MVATDWASLTLAGAFVAGLAAGVVASLWIAKVFAKYLIELRRDAQKPPD